MFYFCPEFTWSSKTLILQIYILFNSLSRNSLFSFYLTIFMILFGCLVTHRIWGMVIVICLFDTGNNKLAIKKKNKHMHLFKIRVFTDDMMLIHSVNK